MSASFRDGDTQSQILKRQQPAFSNPLQMNLQSPKGVLTSNLKITATEGCRATQTHIIYYLLVSLSVGVHGMEPPWIMGETLYIYLFI